jgi:hypothetical protein
LFHPISRHGLPSDGRLNVLHRTFESARAAYPHDERTALRAYAKSEASRIANKLVLPVQGEPAFDALASQLIDLEWTRLTALRSRRYDLVMMLMRSGRFERKIARRLIAQGKLSPEVLA